MSTVFLHLDAFSRDYLSALNTPFLWKCSREGEHCEGVGQSLGPQWKENTAELVPCSLAENEYFMQRREWNNDE